MSHLAAVPTGPHLAGSADIRDYYVRMSQVDPKDMRWLWPGRIPFGAVTTLFGAGGVGKSTLACEIAARRSRREPLAGEFLTGGNTLFITTEDSHSHVVRPRLSAADADLDQIACWRLDADEDGNEPPELPQLPRDTHLIEAGIELFDADLIVIEVTTILEPSINVNHLEDVRRVITPLQGVAQRRDVAIVLIVHVNKTSGLAAIDRVGGSKAWTDAARQALMVAADPDAPNDAPRAAIAVAKSNYAPKADTLTFTITSTTADGVATSHVSRWNGTTQRTADDLVTTQDDRTAVDDACDFLKEELSDGPMASTIVIQHAHENGVSDRTLSKARKRLGVKPTRVGDSWVMSLPKAKTAP